MAVLTMPAWFGFRLLKTALMLPTHLAQVWGALLVAQRACAEPRQSVGLIAKGAASL